jgi:outer membrane immunogenic protein
VLGGYSWAHFKAGISAGGGGPSLSHGWGSSGYSIGGGLETAVTANTTLGIEYRYAQFSDKDLSAGFGAPPGSFKVEPSSHTVRVGLKYKFN